MSPQSRLLRGIRTLLADPEPRQPAKIPEDVRVYAIGDIHGCNGLLRDLHGRISNDIDATGQRLRVVVVYLGDFIDRGPDSRDVIEQLLSTPLPNTEAHFLLGNHESALLDFLADPEAGGNWLGFGGAETAHSYGITLESMPTGRWRQRLRDDLLQKISPEHLHFFRSLQTRFEIGDYAFVHAGIAPGIPIAQQATDDMLWIREPFLSSNRWHGKRIVHGHSIVRSPEIHINRIAVDTGAYATGILSCAVLQDEDVRFLSAMLPGLH
jgi:serine/threonine protein phosphatase 1